jgi:carboxyl-terminal processing protease
MNPRFKPVVVGLVLGTALSVVLPFAFASRTSEYRWMDPILVIHAMVAEDFVQAPDDEKLQVAAIQGMLEALEDPYTVYVPPADEASFTKALQGSYVGIGAEIQIVNNYLTIVTPLEDSPALEAGVMSGDTVLEIDGASTYGLTSEQCADRLMGDPGTTVRLKLRHEDGRESEVTITRRQIVTRTIKGVTRQGTEWNYTLDADNGIGYVRLTQFTESTVPNLVAALQSLGPNLKGLILDLRFNGGGTLAGAIETSDLFLKSGQIVSVRGRDGESRTATAAEADTLPEFPMVVLVNGASASASEIVAGALQDNGRAKVLGTRTYGKGSVQEVRELGDQQGTLKLTTARYYLPSGRNIDRVGHGAMWGVDPDPGFHVPMTNAEYQKMFESRRKFEIMPTGEAPMAQGQWGDAAWIEEAIGDKELAAALRATQGFLASGTWPVVGGEGGVTAAVGEELAQAETYLERLAEQAQQVQKRINELEGLPEAPAVEAALPPDAPLKNGRVEVRDEAGNVVAVFQIDDPAQLSAALTEARLRKVPN